MGVQVIALRVIDFPGARVIGRTARVGLDVTIEDRTIQDLWERAAADGTLDALFALPGRVSPDGAAPGLDRAAPGLDRAGYMGDFTPGADHYTYLAGVLFAPGTPLPALAEVPPGLEYRDIPACALAAGWLQETPTPEGGDLFADASDNLHRAMAARGLVFDGAHGLFELEVTTAARFDEPARRAEPRILDFYTPCKPAAAPATPEGGTDAAE